MRNNKVFFKHLRVILNEEEFLIFLDFAESYAFIIQNAAQAFHWNNNQATAPITSGRDSPLSTRFIM